MNTKLVPFEGQYAADIVHIRRRVFVEEQGVDEMIDFDGRDEAAAQVLVYQDDQAIATARMLDDGHIGRIAVLKTHRKLGAGRCALIALIKNAREKKLEKVYLGSQTHAAGFYLKYGFNICGDVFMEAGIEHVEMELYL